MAIDHTVSPMASKADSPEKPASARSPAYRNYLRSLRLKTMFVRGWQLAVLAAFLVLWEIAPRAGWVNPLLTSYPSAVFQTLRDLSADGSLYMHTWATVRSTFVGFVAGSAIGLVVAIALWLSPTLYRILDPFVVVVNALPKIALVPIFYIWLGDVMSIYAMAISVSVFVTVLMLYTGFQAIEPEKTEAGQAVRCVEVTDASPDRAARLRADADLHAEGQRGPDAHRRHRGGVPIGEGGSRVPDHLWRPDLPDESRDGRDRCPGPHLHGAVRSDSGARADRGAQKGLLKLARRRTGA
jgi:hypothetical protein